MTRRVGAPPRAYGLMVDLTLGQAAGLGVPSRLWLNRTDGAAWVDVHPPPPAAPLLGLDGAVALQHEQAHLAAVVLAVEAVQPVRHDIH